MIDSEDEPVNNNNMLNNNMLNKDMFIALENSHSNPDCRNIGPDTCDNRDLCQWTCKTRFNSDRYRGCCKRKQIRRPTPNPTRRPTPTPTSSGGSGTSFDDGLAQDVLWRRVYGELLEAPVPLSGGSSKTALIAKFVLRGGMQLATGAQSLSIEVPELV